MTKLEQIKQIDLFVELVKDIPYNVPIYEVVDYLLKQKQQLKSEVTVLEYIKSILQ